MNELSEYEQRRLENIRQNQQVLQSLHISKLPLLPAMAKSTTIAKPKAKHVMSEEQGSLVVQLTRRSSRLLQKQLGICLLDREKENSDCYAVAKRKPRPPRVVNGVQCSPQIGATDDYLECVGGMLLKEAKALKDEQSCGIIDDSSIHFDLKSKSCVVKVFRDRIYSMAIHPTPDRVMAVAGSKEGELGFWDATRVLEDGFEFNDGCVPKCFLFSPHTGSIGNLRFCRSDSSKLLTTSYDGSCLMMDIDSGTFQPWFSMDSKHQAVTTGLDVSRDGRLAFHSDTDGVFRVTDLRSFQTVQQLQLHEDKIGGVSVSSDEHTLATCSNDRSIAIWDVRRLSSKLYSFGYKNAVTSVSFHPTIADCFVSSCYDDHLRIHSFASSIDIPHNNKTGKWITLFKAIWDPKSDANKSLIYIGNMEHRGVDIYNINGQHVQCAQSFWLTAQPAVNAVHSAMNVVVSGNASGKIAIWSNE